MSDPFNRLGIAPGSTRDVIKRAYRTLAKQCHPDLRKDKEAASAEFRELTKIYEAALLVCGKAPKKKAERPPPPRPQTPIIVRCSLGLIDDYEYTNFGAISRYVRVPRTLLEYGGTILASYTTTDHESKAFQFIIYPKTQAGQTLRFNMPIGIVEILLVPEG